MKSLGELVSKNIYPIKSFSTLKDEMVEPEKVANFQKFMPGAGERVFGMMEKEQNHRHGLEKKQVETWSRVTVLKTWGMIVVGAVLLIVSLILIYQGHLKEGLGLIGGSGFVSLVNAGYKFVKGN